MLEFAKHLSNELVFDAPPVTNRHELFQFVANQLKQKGIITNPDLPSVADALKMAKIAESQGKQVLGTVVNRVKGKWHELTRKEIEEMVGATVLVEIPEDRNVSMSIAAKTPVVNYDPNSPASIEIRKLAHMFVGLPFNVKKPRSFRLLERLIGWLTR